MKLTLGKVSAVLGIVAVGSSLLTGLANYYINKGSTSTKTEDRMESLEYDRDWLFDWQRWADHQFASVKSGGKIDWENEPAYKHR